jgi:hypothetical protein
VSLRLRLSAILVAAALALVFIPLRWQLGGPSFAERHRPEAKAQCRVDPELKFREYPLADGTDPAPDLDPFEYCVAAYISHLPAD